MGDDTSAEATTQSEDWKGAGPDDVLVNKEEVMASRSPLPAEAEKDKREGGEANITIYG